MELVFNLMRNFQRLVVLFVVGGVGVGAGIGIVIFKVNSLENITQTLSDKIEVLVGSVGQLGQRNSSFVNLGVVSDASPSSQLGTAYVRVNDQGQVIFNSDVLESLFPDAVGGNPLYFDSEDWKVASNLFFSSGRIGIGRSPNSTLEVEGTARVSGKLTIDHSDEDHLIELTPRNDTGFLSSSGGVVFINNTENPGTGYGIYSNAGSEAEGNMINVKVDNPEFGQAAFYMDYDGISNAVEIKSNTNDTSSNALSITNNNRLDSAVGVIGYETGRGTVKITHIGTGSDTNASGLSIDLQGTGTAAQGLYVDSTATGGTTGDLLRLRNETTDRFVVDSAGSVTIGATGTDTSITKLGNNANDHFFVGTNGAFRVQRSATNSEAFRVQVSGDSFGRWLGTSDGQLKWSSGSADYDVVLKRSGATTLQLDGATFDSVSSGTNTDVMKWTASDGSRLGRFVETSGGHGWFEVDNNSGTALIVLRADGGNSYINSGNFGIGTTAFGTDAAKVIAIGNGTAPSTSIADGVQLFAVDFDDGDGTATSELRVRDEDGNVTTVSPHNFSLLQDQERQPLDWSYYSERDGLAINANIAQVIRTVEELSGKQLLFIQNLETGENVRQVFDGQVKTQLTSEQAQKIEKDVQNIEDEVSVLKTVINWGQELLTISQDLVVESLATFERSVRFMANTVFQGKAEFEDEVKFEDQVIIEGPIVVGDDQAGEAVVTAGHTQVELIFNQYPGITPIVNVTPREFIEGRYKLEKTESSFKIILEQAQSQDIWFDWQIIRTGERLPASSLDSQTTVAPTATNSATTSPLNSTTSAQLTP